jgi:hypothetical protein
MAPTARDWRLPPEPDDLGFETSNPVPRPGRAFGGISEGPSPPALEVWYGTGPRFRSSRAVAVPLQLIRFVDSWLGATII